MRFQLAKTVIMLARRWRLCENLDSSGDVSLENSHHVVTYHYCTQHCIISRVLSSPTRLLTARPSDHQQNVVVEGSLASDMSPQCASSSVADHTSICYFVPTMQFIIRAN